jgi:hypothetical protein
MHQLGASMIWLIRRLLFRAQAATLDYVEAQAELEQTPDPCDTHLAVALGRVTVAGREQCTWHDHGQMSFAPTVRRMPRERAKRTRFQTISR